MPVALGPELAAARPELAGGPLRVATALRANTRGPDREGGTSPMTGTETAILEDLSRLLSDFQGREYSAPIDAETRFFADLGLASIDAVVLGETLEAHYGRRLPFASLMGDLAGARTATWRWASWRHSWRST
jgi:acyl carrier protein